MFYSTEWLIMTFVEKHSVLRGFRKRQWLRHRLFLPFLLIADQLISSIMVKQRGTTLTGREPPHALTVARSLICIHVLQHGNREKMVTVIEQRVSKLTFHFPLCVRASVRSCICHTVSSANDSTHYA